MKSRTSCMCEQAAIGRDMFAVLMEATKYCSLGQLTAAIPLRRDRLFEVGGGSIGGTCEGRKAERHPIGCLSVK